MCVYEHGSENLQTFTVVYHYRISFFTLATVVYSGDFSVAKNNFIIRLNFYQDIYQDKIFKLVQMQVQNENYLLFNSFLLILQKTLCMFTFTTEASVQKLQLEKITGFPSDSLFTTRRVSVGLPGRRKMSRVFKPSLATYTNNSYKIKTNYVVIQ